MATKQQHERWLRVMALFKAGFVVTDIAEQVKMTHAGVLSVIKRSGLTKDEMKALMKDHRAIRKSHRLKSSVRNCIRCGKELSPTNARYCSLECSRQKKFEVESPLAQKEYARQYYQKNKDKIKRKYQEETTKSTGSQFRVTKRGNETSFSIS